MGSDTVAQQHPVDRVQDSVAARLLRKAWEEIERRYAPQHVILFGSRATGRARPDSDVDLIVVSSLFEGRRLVDRMSALREILSDQQTVPIDVLCYTPEEFEVMGTGIGMVAEAVKEGIWVR